MAPARACRCRILFTDPITVTGPLRREEMMVRSGAMGEFVFTPPGLDERLIREAGFVNVRVEDVSEGPARVASAWHAARERRAAQLDEVEGAEENASNQRFLAAVAALARERRLSRFAYLAQRPWSLRARSPPGRLGTVLTKRAPTGRPHGDVADLDAVRPTGKARGGRGNRVVLEAIAPGEQQRASSMLTLAFAC